MIKKIVLVSLALFIIIGTVLFIYRYQVIKYSAEAIIRNLLPAYVKVDKINFDFKDSKVILSGFKILGPPDYSHRYLVEVDEIITQYTMKGKSILEGIKITEPVISKMSLNIERLPDGRLNVAEMPKVIEEDLAKKEAKEKASKKRKKESKAEVIKLSDVLKLPETFLIRDGKFMFIDRFNLPRPHMVTIERINANLILKMDESYSKVLSVASSGEGSVNGRGEEAVRWDVIFNPTTPGLTMSNRFEVSGVDILSFEPYYDKYSPFIFKRGRFSGTLVFDFDNGNIGSTNEIHLSNLQFSIKQGYENAQFWETTVPDLVKYFSTPYGEVVFDFKIKGSMSEPQFYLGPISKQALVSMAVDKVSAAIQEMSNKGQGQSGGAKSDVEKVKGYIDLFKGLMDKK